MSIEDFVTLNEKILEEFSNKIETSINQICENNPNIDPRLELLIALGMFSVQVGVDSGYDKKEFMDLIEEIFDSFQEDNKIISMLN